VTISEITDAILELTKIQKDGPKTKFQRLDRTVGGVWLDGVAISGERGVGKSLLVDHMMIDFAMAGNEVVKLDLENNRRHILERLFLIFACRVLGRESAPQKMELRDYPKWMGNVGINRKWHDNMKDRIWLIDSAYEKRLTPEQIDELVKERWEVLAPMEKQVILIVDSFDVLNNRFPLCSGEYESQQRWLSEIQAIGTKYQIPIILISHMGKSGPFKGTTAIQHYARTQILLEPVENEPNTVIVNVLRAQYGEASRIRMEIDRTRLALRERGVTVP